MGDKGDKQMRPRPQGEEADMEWTLQGREVHGMADEQRSNGTPRTDVPEQQGKEARHGSEERRKVREGAEGSQNTLAEGADCGDVRDGPVIDGDEDTRERKKRESVTKTRHKRLLKNHTRQEEEVSVDSQRI